MSRIYSLVLLTFILFEGCTEKHPSYKGVEDEFLELQKEILSVKIGLDSTTAANLTLEEINSNLSSGKFRFRTLNTNDIEYIHRLIAFAKAAPVTATEKAVVETDLGTITITFYSTLAPAHCANFKLLANSGYYDGIPIHKIIPGRAIFMGSITAMDFYSNNDGSGSPGYTVKSELNNALHKRGVVIMEKSENSYFGSHGSQFFILLKNASSLYSTHTPFGEVSDGMETIEKIGNLVLKNNTPIETIRVKKIRVID